VKGSEHEAQRGLPYGVQDLDAGGMLDHSLYLFRDNFKLIVLAYCAFSLPLNLLAIASVVYLQHAYHFFTTPLAYESLDRFNLVNSVNNVLHFLVSYPFSAAAVIYGIGIRYFGGKASFFDCVKVAFRRWPACFATSLLYAVMMGVGAMLCILPGIVAYLVFYLALPVLILERVSPIEALSRSRKLMQGFLLITLLLSTVVSIAGVPFGAILVSFPNFLVSMTLVLLFGNVLSFFHMVLSVVIYTTARCHGESMDLDLVADRVDEPLVAEGAVL